MPLAGLHCDYCIVARLHLNNFQHGALQGGFVLQATISTAPTTVLLCSVRMAA